MAELDVLDIVRQSILQHHMFDAVTTVVVGVSGGPDSLCLLHVLRSLQQELGFNLHLAHLDHGIRGADSRQDAEYVEEFARAWGVPSTIERGDVPAYAEEHGLAIEEAARRVRYLFLGRVARKVGAECVAVGHNADDQVETIIMHWMRGSGLGGLRGMLPVQVLGAEGWWTGPLLRLVRPLLDLPRQTIEDYCREHGLQPRFDRSNLDLTYHRNRIRRELIPYLESFNPRIRDVLRRSARAIAADYDYLHGQALHAWERLAEESDGAVTFPLKAWLGLHPSLQRQLLRESIRRLRSSLRDITWSHVEQARAGVSQIAPGARITLPQGLFLFKGYEDFVIGETIPLPDLPLLTGRNLAVEVPGSTRLPGSAWVLHSRIVDRQELPDGILQNPDPWQAYLDLEKTGRDLALRTRERGDRLRPLGMAGRSKSLNDFMVDAKIPLHVRDSLPVVVCPRHIVWVAGYRIDERAKITSQTRLVLDLHFVKAA